MYCVKCRAKTDSTDIHHVITKNNRQMMKGTCTQCGCKKSQFVGGKLDIHKLIGSLPRPKRRIYVTGS